MDIYLLRHPPVQNSSGVCYGQTDLPLIEDWKKTVEPIQKILPKNLEIYSSDLERCRDVANYLSDQKINFDQRLRELNFGIWENKPWKDISREDIEAWNHQLATYMIPGGESYSKLSTRVIEAFNEIVSAQKDTLIITHGGVVRVILAYLLEASVDAIFKLTVDYSSLTKIVYHAQWQGIEYINRVFNK